MTLMQGVKISGLNGGWWFAYLPLRDTAKLLEDFKQGLPLQITKGDGSMLHFNSAALVCLEVWDLEETDARGGTTPPPAKSRKPAS